MGGHYILKINNLCNLNCCFCADSLEIRSKPDIPLNILKKNLDQGRKEFESLIITGGEPTIYEHIRALIQYAKQICGYKQITLVTNALLLHQDSNVAALLDDGVDAFQISFSTSFEPMFDAIVKKKGSFHFATKAIQNIKARNAEVRINTVIHKLNIKYLPETVEYLINLRVDKIQLSLMNPVGSSIVDGQSAIAVPIKEIKPYIDRSFEVANKYSFQGLYIENFPICTMPEYEDAISDLRKPEENKEYYNNLKTKPNACQSCRQYSKCDGIWIHHLKQFGESELNQQLYKVKTDKNAITKPT